MHFINALNREKEKMHGCPAHVLLVLMFASLLIIIKILMRKSDLGCVIKTKNKVILGKVCRKCFPNEVERNKHFLEKRTF